jgi:hypothetical protein
VPIVAYTVEQLNQVAAFLEERDYIVSFRFVWNDDLIKSAQTLALYTTDASNLGVYVA